MQDAAIGMGVGGLVASIGQMAWQRFFSTEGKAHTELVRQLGERIASQEARIERLEERLHEEFSKRLEAEERIARLRHRVLRLEGKLRYHGIEVPPPDEHTHDGGH